jgi:ssDNA-binding Zn-finger/Zn-ribbon topoisomerase 1
MITYGPLCPECGGAMVVRTNKQTDEQFYGCSFYPHCTGTRQIEEEDTTEDIPSDKYRRADRDRWRQ